MKRTATQRASLAHDICKFLGGAFWSLVIIACLWYFITQENK